MFNDILAPEVDRGLSFLGYLGWALIGLSPLITYFGYQLLARRAKSSPQWSSTGGAFVIFLLCYLFGMMVLRHAVPSPF
jgi:hypothetical protein